MRKLKVRELKPLGVVSDEPGFRLNLTVKALVHSATPALQDRAPEKTKSEEETRAVGRNIMAQARRTAELSIPEAREEMLSRRKWLLRKQT